MTTTVETPEKVEKYSIPRRKSIYVWVAAVVLISGVLLCLLFRMNAIKLANPSVGLRIASRILRCAVVAACAGYAVKRRSQAAWIFVAMLGGIELGMDAPRVALHMQVLSDIFLRLIKVIVAPLILTTLISGIARHGNLKDIQRLGLRTLIYFQIMTSLALVIGLLAINISKAGVGVGDTSRQYGNAGTAAALAKLEAIQPATTAISWSDYLLHLFPENIAKSIADEQIMQLVIFALLFGIALATVPEHHRKPVLQLVESIGQVMFRFTNIVMRYAPIGVGAAMAYTVGQMGVGFLLNCGKLLLTLYGALFVFTTLVLLPISALVGVPIRRFLTAIAEPATIAFAANTSTAALPSSMESMEELGVPEWISSFVIPTGYSFNLTGSTLSLAVLAVFTAQANGIHLSMGQQLLMLGVLMVASKGIAGVARGTFIVLMATLPDFHLAVWPLMLVFGIDILMDLARTLVNVVGNCQAAVVMAIWEKEFQLPLLRKAQTCAVIPLSSPASPETI